MFSIEAIYAEHGDCLLLQYGSGDPHPSWMLIDGGTRVWDDFVEPRLRQLAQEWSIDGPVPLQLVMVSHVDDDHINGVLSLFRHLGDNAQPDKVCTVGQLWHNSFDDVIGGNEKQELVSALVKPVADAPPRDRELEAVIASVGQGRDLRKDAAALAMDTNREFTGLVIAQPGPAQAIDMGDGLTFKVIAPAQARVAEYQEEWNKYLEKKGLAEAEATNFNDSSAFNLASIVVLAEADRKTMLLTGDARGDHVVNGLVEGGLLDAEAAYPERQEGESKSAWRKKVEAADLKDVQPLHVDLLKVPHHGSANNVTTGFFRRVTADHYIMSGNGNHYNPDPVTLQMLADARGADPYTIHFSFHKKQHKDKRFNEHHRECLARVDTWVRTCRPTNCKVKYREDEEEVYSIGLTLAD